MWQVHHPTITFRLNLRYFLVLLTIPVLDVNRFFSFGCSRKAFVFWISKLPFRIPFRILQITQSILRVNGWNFEQQHYTVREFLWSSIKANFHFYWFVIKDFHIIHKAISFHLSESVLEIIVNGDICFIVTSRLLSRTSGRDNRFGSFKEPLNTRPWDLLAVWILRNSIFID